MDSLRERLEGLADKWARDSEWWLGKPDRGVLVGIYRDGRHDSLNRATEELRAVLAECDTDETR